MNVCCIFFFFYNTFIFSCDRLQYDVLLFYFDLYGIYISTIVILWQFIVLIYIFLGYQLMRRSLKKKKYSIGDISKKKIIKKRKEKESQ